MKQRTAVRIPGKQITTLGDMEGMWHANRHGWYARALESRTREQKFSLLDQLHAFSGAGIDVDHHIMQGFGIDEQGKDTLLKAWEADRKPE